MGRERGRTLLAASGNRSEVAIKLPLFNQEELPGMILPGKLVEMQANDETYMALSTGIEITGSRASALSVRQRVTLERWYG